jgi:hypothetical protein
LFDILLLLRESWDDMWNDSGSHPPLGHVRPA